MFFYENLLFLGALAFLSWLVLCFINFVKENQQPSDRLDYSLDSLENSLAEMFICEASTYRKYQAYLVCTTVFCVLYVAWELMKNPEILNVHRTRFAFGLFSRSKENSEKQSKPDGEQYKQRDSTGPILDFETLDATCTIEEYRRITKCLRDEIDKVFNRNNELIGRIVDLEQENLILMGKGLLLAREMNEGYLNRTNDGADVVESLAEENTKDINNTNITVGFTKIISSFISTENEARGAHGDNIDPLSQFHQVSPKGISMFPFLQSLYFINRYIHIHGRRSNIEINNNNTDFNEVWYKYIRMHNMGERISKMFDPNFAVGSEEEDSNRRKNIDFSESESYNTMDTAESNDEENVEKSVGGLSNPILTTEQLQMIHDLGVPLEDIIFEEVP